MKINLKKINLKDFLKRFKKDPQAPSIQVVDKFQDEPKYKKFLNKKVLFPVVGGLLALILIFSFVKDKITCVGGFPVLKSKKEKAEKKPVEETPMPVKVYKISRVSFRDTLPSLGAIKGFREYDLKFPVSGNIEYVNFKEGEKITQGDIIASLDQKEALLKLEYAKIELEKQTKLFELGGILETKLKQSQLEYQSAKTELEKTNLVAVSDGYVGMIDADKGRFVNPQDRVGTFVDTKDVFVEFGVIEKDIPKVRESQNVELTLDSYPDQVFKGQVDSVSPVVESRSRTVKVRSKITNLDEKIRPGMFGRVNVLVYEKEQALVIPSSSFKKKDDKYFVYLVHVEEAPAPAPPAPEKADSKKNKKAKGHQAEAPPVPEEAPVIIGSVEVRPIDVAYATPDAIEVKEGLEEGDTVIVDVEQELQDKQKVEITETQEGIF